MRERTMIGMDKIKDLLLCWSEVILSITTIVPQIQGEREQKERKNPLENPCEEGLCY